MIELGNIQFALDEASLKIPKLGRVRMGLAGDQEDIEHLNSEDDECSPDVEEKILRIIRDNIIANNSSVREVFKIESKASDILVNPYFVKKRLKDVCGLDMPYPEISKFVNKSMQVMMKKLQIKGVLGQEMGMPGYTRARYKTMILAEGIGVNNTSQMDKLFNFKELETMIKSNLRSAGYSQPAIEREEALEGEQLRQMEGNDLQIGVQNDLQHFLKIFSEFLIQYKEADQVKDLA